MRGLTIHQPYVTLIAIGAKQYETRSWETRYRGPLLIHAGKAANSRVAADCDRAAQELKRRGFASNARIGRFPIDQTLGGIVAVAELVNCIRSRRPADFPELDQLFGDLRAGRYGFKLARVRPLAYPVPCPGKQGLWIPPGDVLRRVDLALREAGQPSLFAAQGAMS